MGDVLRTPVRGAVVGRLLGLAARPAAVACLVPAVVAAFTGDAAFAWRAGVVALALGGLGALGRLPDVGAVQRNEALVVAATMFLLIPLAMAWPFTSAGLGYADAAFETISGITTTGLSLVDVGGATPGVLFSRAWLQWIGGLGVVLLSLAVIVPPGAVAAGLDEATLTREGLGTTRSLARRVVLVYAVATAVGVVALLVCGEDLLRAVAYPLAALSTGGFSPDPEGLAALSRPSQRVVVSLCLCGATPALLLGGRMRPAERRVALAQCVVATMLVAGAFVLLEMQLDSGLADRNWHGVVLAASAQTTAGFATVDVARLGAAAELTLVLAMLVGGPTGSTAGGIKVLRLAIAFQVARLAVQRTALPRHAVADLKVARQRFDDAVIARVLLIALLFAGTVLASWLPFVVHGIEPMDALFEVVSATATVGLSSGVTSVDLAPGLKAVLCADMLLGRLEFLALLVMLYPGTWFGRRTTAERAEEDS